MSNAVPREVDGDGFEARLAACGDSLKALVCYMRATAEHAGADVAARRFRHAAPNAGWGVSYYADGLPFCEIHPKSTDEHVWVRLRGVDASAIHAAGFEPSAQQGWFKIRTMREAVRFVAWIIQAHDKRVSAA